jgi:hypothetical protein
LHLGLLGIAGSCQVTDAPFYPATFDLLFLRDGVMDVVVQ